MGGVAVSDVNVDGVSACKGVVVGSGGSGSAERCPPSDSGMCEAGDSSKPVGAQCDTGQRNSPSLLVSSSDGKVYSTLGKAPSISTRARRRVLDTVFSAPACPLPSAAMFKRE